jgi:hypothetical protein
MTALSDIAARRQDAGARYKAALTTLMDTAAELSGLELAFFCACAAASGAPLPDSKFAGEFDLTVFSHPEFAPVTQKDNEHWKGAVVSNFTPWLKELGSFRWVGRKAPKRKRKRRR